MAYLRDDQDLVLFQALGSELKEVRATLKRFQYGNVRQEITALNKKACDIQRKMAELQAKSPVRMR